MTISELIGVLECAQDECGDLKVEVAGGREVFSLSYIFSLPKKKEAQRILAVRIN